MPPVGRLMPMSVQQIQEELKKLTPDELAEVEKHARLLRTITAPGYKERIAEAQRRMDAGKFVAQQEFEAKIAGGAENGAAG